MSRAAVFVTRNVTRETAYVGKQAALIVGLALSIAFACAGCKQSSSTSSSSSGHTINGTLALKYSGSDPGAPCFGHGGFGDIAAGTSVTLTNEDGKVIGVSS